MREYIEQHYPSVELEVCQENLDDFFKFMNERHLIWHRRFIEKLPREQWTTNEILKKSKYTNIYRELDRGTLWWFDHIGNEYTDWKSTALSDIGQEVGFKILLWKTIIYRLCNRIETFEKVGFPDYTKYNSDDVHNDFWKQLHEIEETGASVMTSAHLTCPTPAGYSKVEGYIMAVNSLHKELDSLCSDIPQARDSKDVFNILRRIHCVGAFIAYEVLCDLMYVGAIGLNQPLTENGGETKLIECKRFSEDDWANVGPGAYQGIRLIYPSSAIGRNKSKRVYERMVQLRDEQAEHFKRLGIEFKYYEKYSKGHLSLRSIEHSLCEYSKYWLQSRGLGKVRMIFNPDTHKSKVTDGDKIVVVE